MEMGINVGQIRQALIQTALSPRGGYNPALNYLSNISYETLKELVELLLRGDKDVIDLLVAAMRYQQVIRLRHGVIDPDGTIRNISYCLNNMRNSHVILDMSELAYEPGILYSLQTYHQTLFVANQVTHNFVFAVCEVPKMNGKFYGKQEEWTEWIVEIVRDVNRAIDRIYPDMGFQFPATPNLNLEQMMWEIVHTAVLYQKKNPHLCKVTDSDGTRRAVHPYNLLVEFLFGDTGEVRDVIPHTDFPMDK